MRNVLGILLFVVSTSAFALDSDKPAPQAKRGDYRRGPSAVPEIGVGSAGGAVALLSGTMLVIRGRRKKQNLA